MAYRSTVATHDLSVQADSLADGVLLERAGNGDSDACAALYRRHGATVYRYAWAVSGSEAAAADAVQETFVALMERPAGFDPSRSASCAGYLCGIARHCALRMFDARIDASHDVDDMLDARAAAGAVDLPPLPNDAMERAQSLQALHAAIRQLPPHYRDVLILVELQELSYADAAAAAGIEVGTVRSRLNRAKARLLELLSPASAKMDEPSP